MTLEEKVKLDRISQKYLRECLHYDPDEGTFTWRNRPLHHFKNEADMNRVNARHAGNRAGTYSKSENMTYLQLDGKKFRAAKLAVIHRIAPIGEKCIVCVNGDGSDLRITNLMAVSHSIASTTRPWIHGASRTTGVTKTKYGTYEARISHAGKVKYVGSAKNIDDAIALRQKAVAEYGIRKQHRKTYNTSPTL